MDTGPHAALYRQIAELVNAKYNGNARAFGDAVGISASTILRITHGVPENHSRIMIGRLTRALLGEHPVPGTMVGHRVPTPTRNGAHAMNEVVTPTPGVDLTEALARLDALKERLFEVTLEVEEIEASLRTGVQEAT
jgi:hypothetical protein